MEDQLKKALEFSNYRQTFSTQRRILKEKIDAKLTYGFNGGIFKISRSLITFVQMLIDRGRTSNVPLIDHNENPILIENLEAFRDEIFDRYFSTTLEFYDEYQNLKKSRSVEKLLDL
jgi:hypothetical protein